MKSKTWSWQILCVSVILLLSSCTQSEPLETLDAGEVESLGRHCAQVYGAQIDAWDSKDPENLKEVYTDDIIHFDGEPAFVGIEEVISMAWNVVMFMPGWGMDAGETYISNDLCLGTWVNWNLFGISQDEVGHEYDLHEMRNGKFSFWRLFYDQRFWEAFDDSEYIDQEFLSNFVASWSSGDSADLLNLYAKDAELEDTLFGYSITGHEAIQDYASKFMAKSDDSSWGSIDTFAESEASPAFREQYPIASHGGIFAITVPDVDDNACEIRFAVILTPNEEGLIQSQQIFYNADTLIDCGWAQ